MISTLTQLRPLMSVEEELMTLVGNQFPADFEDDLFCPLLKAVAKLAPCISGPSGVFCPYGRIYADSGHIEIALIEADSPDKLALIRDRFHTLLKQAAVAVSQEGKPLQLANNNHAGLLQEETAVWGSHENYLVERHPKHFTANILPYLATRIYAGSGGIRFPSGEFVASVRVEFLSHDTGGNTTHDRALHSTCREESLMGRSAGFRWHLISADGHVCQSNLALQSGTAWLAAKCAIFDPELPRDLQRLDWLPRVASWVRFAQHANRLASPGESPRVDPRVIDVQRIYLDSMRRFVAETCVAEEWMPRILNQLQATIDAWQRNDIDWLAARFDAFAKYKLWDGMLDEMGKTWGELPNDRSIMAELALVSQSFHEFTDPNNVFSLLESAGVLEHRVGYEIPPGGESEPFEPEVNTRAKARARWICQNSPNANVVMDWDTVSDYRLGTRFTLSDPFATEYVESVTGEEQSRRVSSAHAQSHETLTWESYEHYVAGDYEAAANSLDAALQQMGNDPARCTDNYFRYRAWVQSRRGYLDGVSAISTLCARTGVNTNTIVDACVTLRFQGLIPSPEMEHWIEIAREHFRRSSVFGGSDEISFRTSRAALRLAQGRTQEAFDDLESTVRSESFRLTGSRQSARLLCTLGEAHRRLGRRFRAAQAFRRAATMYLSSSAQGEWAELALTGLAKLARRPADALRRLAEIHEIQQALNHHVGLVRTMLLEARRGIDAVTAQDYRLQITRYQDRLPALAACPLLTQILRYWDLWRAGQTPPGIHDEYWCL